MKPVFSRTNLLLPQGIDWEKWSVIACDQYTSDAAGYWRPLDAQIGSAPSTLRMILPECDIPAQGLESAALEEHIQDITEHMFSYLEQGLFSEYQNVYLYVERLLPSGKLRRGLCGKLDLEAYSYLPGAKTPVRPTEGTIESRLPVRAAIRARSPLELPHILVLLDDPSESVIEPLGEQKASLQQVYDFSLCRGGGRVAGWLIEASAADAVDAALSRLLEGKSLQIAMGDGNHSLAAAKLCWETLKPTLSPAERLSHSARFALVELENIADPAVRIEPIHRVLFHTDPGALLAFLRERLPAQGALELRWCMGEESGTLRTHLPANTTAAGLIQPLLDDWVKTHGGELDYIHGEAELRRLSKRPDTLGLLLPGMEKSSLFPCVEAAGVLPRKAFSMGEAEEKRYYLECRKIK